MSKSTASKSSTVSSNVAPSSSTKVQEAQKFTPSYATHFRNVALNMTYKCEDVRQGMLQAGLAQDSDEFEMLLNAEAHLTSLLNALDAKASAPLFHEKAPRAERTPHTTKSLEREAEKAARLQALKEKLNAK